MKIFIFLGLKSFVLFFLFTLIFSCQKEPRYSIADFALDSTLPALMIDRSGSGDYHMHNMELYYPSGQDSDHVYWFTDLQWDTDGSGTNAFCFVLEDIIKQDESDGLQKL